jgi:hypothetical protein
VPTGSDDGVAAPGDTKFAVDRSQVRLDGIKPIRTAPYRSRPLTTSTARIRGPPAPTAQRRRRHEWGPALRRIRAGPVVRRAAIRSRRRQPLDREDPSGGRRARLRRPGIGILVPFLGPHGTAQAGSPSHRRARQATELGSRAHNRSVPHVGAVVVRILLRRRPLRALVARVNPHPRGGMRGICAPRRVTRPNTLPRRSVKDRMDMHRPRAPGPNSYGRSTGP